ncbi:BTAD domain-containing putative transcriptional regulator [Falsibacillus albus]|uniref:Transcriptional regulator n=1 Tax=Falsibacillus albus TaxID=2478915 RepID=A0A3L7K4R9_9BACI|nr:BTAD domain-containing putative transcriptional regulator [Falsibacillus albus]RLQ97259.1 transcriptional regulator [Falsibacillus albus]
MNSSMIIVDTKLIPPMVKDTFVRRPSLMKKMKAISDHSATLLHSGAGYGKSAALSLYLSDGSKKICWYTITSSDDDILPFVTYIIHAIRRKYGEFGEDLLEYIQTMDKYFREEQLNTLTSAFMNELTNIREEMIIVLDDFHLVDHSFTINQWLERVIDLLPVHIHLVISSRVRPKWKQLAKWKLSKKLFEIGEADLILNHEEIELLFTDFYHTSLQPDEVVQIHEFTEGWVIALAMIGEQLDNQAGGANELSSILKHQHSTMDELFRYLAHEVFSQQSSIIQHFLKQTSILEEITPEICDEILGFPASEMMLEQLSGRNTFVQKTQGTKQYRFHALFKVFLERKLQEEDPVLFKELHQKSAKYYIHKQQWELAIFHYEKIHLNSAIGELLEKWGPQMLQAGKLEGLYERLKKLPLEVKNQYLALWLYEGDVLRYRSFYDKAEKCYLRLIELSQSKGQYRLCSKAHEGIAKIYLDTIQPMRAEKYLFRALELLEKTNHQTLDETQELYRLITENFVNSGNAMKAEKWYGKLSAENFSLQEGNLDARMFLRTGRLAQAKEVLIERQSLQTSSVPQSHRETDLLISLIEVFMGNGENAKKLAQKGIEQGIRYQTPFIEACGWIRMGHAVQQLERYESSLAEQCYMTALSIMETINVSRGKAEPYMGLCILYGRNGETEKAQEVGNKALYETKKVQDLWLSSLIQLCMGISYVYRGDYEAALKLINAAHKGAEICGDQYGEALGHYWQAVIASEIGDIERFSLAMNRFLKDVQFGQYEFIFFRQTTFGPRDLQSHVPLLIKAKELGIYPAFTQKILKEIGHGEIESHPGYTLSIKTFGEFKVKIGEAVIEERDWQREKARELLQFFVIHRGEWWRKEDICHELWPENDEKSNERDFKVALNALNNALEPNRKPREKPFFIQRLNNGYGLNIKAVIEIDCSQMKQLVQEGIHENQIEKAVILLRKGLSLYSGEFLAERKGERWCQAEKEKWKLIFLRGAERLAQQLVQMQAFDEAIQWCDTILIYDSSWEEAYRLLMFCYYHKNNRPQAIKWYKKCINELKEELGVEPMEPTKQMYEMILNADEYNGPITY